MKTNDIEKRLCKLIISTDISINDAIPILDRSGIGLLLLCEQNRKLIAVLTDGDIRRAILRREKFDNPCISIANKDPIIAPPGITPAEVIHIMDHSKDFLVNHLPLVDENGRVVDLLLRRDLFDEEQMSLSAVIMAGGKGKRLRPVTEKIPKPMLPVGNRPLMELMLDKLRKSGISKVSVSTHFKPEKIKQHFGDGADFGVNLNYIDEDQPLGTAGAIGLMDRPDKTMLIINGDILTHVNFRAMLDFHKEHRAEITVAVREVDIAMPYGVLECDGATVNKLSEKPTLTLMANAGIYLIEPDVYHLIPKNKKFDMTDLINELLKRKRPVVSFPIMEYWLDIGRPDDYQRAQVDIKNGRIKL